ncbi:MAG: hypothetical protein CSA81_10410 [Acidobacteria bacterium]|nr:MAG: hypothetical protein CSA81_10410 [Acidobacteriota bacterium]PIE91231.1 MAG: hypothetical protein CR997_02135 [Acidobacteriota bacterium]
MIKITNLNLTYPNTNIAVLKNMNFHLHTGEFVTVIGRSGSGKSTLLDLMMGLVNSSSGTIEKRNKLTMGYVFQRPALLAWRNVLKNTALPLQIEKMPKAEREEKAMQALRKVGLGYAATLYPHQLSGGMSQRVAIARALVQDPDLLLMDEPFSSIDPLLRENLNINLLKLWSRMKKTVLFVTHSINEAVLLSDRILILEEGCFIEEFKIDLPRPRTFDTPQSSKFLNYVKTIHGCLPCEPNMARELKF